MPDLNTRIGLIYWVRRMNGWTLRQAVEHVDLVGEDAAREWVRKQKGAHDA